MSWKLHEAFSNWGLFPNHYKPTCLDRQMILNKSGRNKNVKMSSGSVIVASVSEMSWWWVQLRARTKKVRLKVRLYLRRRGYIKIRMLIGERKSKWKGWSDREIISCNNNTPIEKIREVRSSDVIWMEKRIVLFAVKPSHHRHIQTFR